MVNFYVQYRSVQSLYNLRFSLCVYAHPPRLSLIHIFFPAFLIALVLQALLFSFGGFAVLGVNLCVMALPALLVHWLFAKRLENDNSRRTQIAAGIGAGVIGVGGSALLASLVLALDGGKAYSDLIMLLVISHIPVFIIDSIVSIGAVSYTHLDVYKRQLNCHSALALQNVIQMVA